MVFWRRLWRTRGNEKLQEKLVEMATEFCLEASVLVTVLGILDSAISTQRVPSFRVFVLSVLVGAMFFAMGLIIQAWKLLDSSSLPADEGEGR